MTELSSRVEAQRQILKSVNGKICKNEQLFALSTAAIRRWTAVNNINSQSRLVKLLNSASAEIFVMANHSDDPIAGTYTLTRQRVATIERDVQLELEREESHR
jgi:hypothetical protein